MSEKVIDHKMIINGDFVDSVNKQKIQIECPANKQIFATVPRGIKEDVDIAVKSSLIAFQSWSKVNPKERGKILLNIADDIDGQKEEIAKIIAKETGNAIRTQARPEINLVVDIFRYFGGLSSELKGETIPLGEHVLSYTRREPLGVVGAIIPWNAPVMLAACKIAPALCTGNTLVMKANVTIPGAPFVPEATMRQKFPNKYSQKIEANMQGQKMTLTKTTFNGERGYTEMQGQRIEFDEKQIEDSKNVKGIFDELYYSADQLELVSINSVNYQDAYKV